MISHTYIIATPSRKMSVTLNGHQVKKGKYVK